LKGIQKVEKNKKVEKNARCALIVISPHAPAFSHNLDELLRKKKKKYFSLHILNLICLKMEKNTLEDFTPATYIVKIVYCITLLAIRLVFF
jgi:hypothetical protein